MQDPRRLGGVVLDPGRGPSRRRRDRPITPAALRAALGTSTAPLKARLMNQAHLAGVGNLIADEALWRAGLDPSPPRPFAERRRAPPPPQAPPRVGRRPDGPGRVPHRRPPSPSRAGRPLPEGRHGAPTRHRRRPDHVVVPEAPALASAGQHPAERLRIGCDDVESLRIGIRRANAPRGSNRCGNAPPPRAADGRVAEAPALSGAPPARGGRPPPPSRR